MSPARRPRAAAATPAAPDQAPLARVRYVPGMLLGADEFECDRHWVIGHFRRHNRWLHGCGVVTGFGVSIVGGQVEVAPGYALDCDGGEIVSGEPVRAALPADGAVRFVVVLADEKLTDPVPIFGEPDGETATFSRIVEAARVTLLDADPAQGHRRAGGHWRACGVAHGVTVAKLARARGAWRVDTRFRVRRAAS